MKLNRCEIFANYILKNKSTIRKTAKFFGFSKSLVHNDLSKKLPKINIRLFNKVHKLLEKNYKEKHIRGGIATKEKYLCLKRKFLD